MQTNMVCRSAARAGEWIRNTIKFRRELGDLERLTDRDLRDMGIDRYDVIALAKKMKDQPIGR
jgi:uncharacterized protein YjiS (DUF1127 family)